MTFAAERKRERAIGLKLDRNFPVVERDWKDALYERLSRVSNNIARKI